MTADLLAFEHAGKLYGAFAALCDVSLAVQRQQFVVLLGPSGSGKSTMLRCAAGIERLTSGRLLLDGQVLDDGRQQVPPERRGLAMVFQDYALWPHLTAQQNVAYALRRLKLDRAEVDGRAAKMLARAGLERLAARYPSELSGGEQQRVALARALVAQPRLLLFDEPLSNLDANLRERMRLEIALLVREAEASALYITHDQSEAFALADRIGILSQGQLVQFGLPQDIYSAPASPFVARLTGLSGELRGAVTQRQQDVVGVAVAGHEVLARPMAALPSTHAVVLVRPSAVQLAAPSSNGHLPGVVKDVAFCGRGYEHVVELRDRTILSAIFDEARWERGQNVSVVINRTGSLAFPVLD
ncbi:MAG: ABC transporter ATP-binding protein [Chloroflexi bacterium]|nr:ABC transporter ATP-binding protein [Chloroflexota bacterium]